MKAVITQTESEAQLLGLAIERNAAHGLQMSGADKKRMARQLYVAKTYDRAGLQSLLSVSEKSLQRWLEDIDKAEKEDKKQKVREMYLACSTFDEICTAIQMSEQFVKDVVSDISDKCLKNPKVTFTDEHFTSPLYNVWTFGKKTNEITHYGNSEQRIVDNLLYLYTPPHRLVLAATDNARRLDIIIYSQTHFC